MTNLIRAFELDQSRRCLASSTIRRRRYSLRLFAAWLAPRDLLEATTDDVQRFLDARHGVGGGPLNPRGRYCWVSTLAAFYRWAVREGLIDEDPTVGIVRPRLRPLLPRPADVDRVRTAISAADPQMRCWLLLAALAGLRCQGIAGLDRDDVADGARPPVVRVVEKGGRARVVPLHPELVAALHVLPMPRVGPVFTRADGSRFEAWQVSQRGNRYLAAAGVGATMHQLRHLFATLLYSETSDIRLVADLLGHANVATTAGYAKVVQRRAVDAVARLSLEG